MDAAEPIRRRWLSHEWHVLLVIALVAATPLGWLTLEAYKVRNRRFQCEQIRAHGGRVLSGVRSNPSVRTLIRPAEPDSSISWIRCQFGDERVDEIWFDSPLTDSDRVAIAAFPEAEVVRIPISLSRQSAP